jgi:hypothetical protein
MRAVMAGQNAGKKLPLSKAKVRHLKRIGRNGGCVTRDNPATVAKAVENVRRDVGKTGFKMLPRCRHEIREMKLTIEPEALAKHVRGKKRKP